MQRSDHSFRPPTPATTLAFKSPNACNLCHGDKDADKDAAWADKLVRQWHKDDYQAPVLYKAWLIETARKKNWSSLPDMLKYIAGKDNDSVFTASLIRLLDPCEDRSKWPVLRQALQNSSPLVRSAAATALGSNLDLQSCEALLKATADDYRLVRIATANALAPFPRERLDPESRKKLELATGELEKSLKCRPDDYASHCNLGNYHSARGELRLAVEAYETAMKLEPRSPLPLVSASLVYARIGDGAKAEQALRKALHIDPANAEANFNLSLLLEDRKQAEKCLRAALETDPGFAQAAYNLGVLLTEDRLDEALVWCRKAHSLRPNELKYIYTLGGIYEKQGKRADAIAVYRQAEANANLPDAERARFSARALELSQP